MSGDLLAKLESQYLLLEQLATQVATQPTHVAAQRKMQHNATCTAMHVATQRKLQCRAEHGNIYLSISL